MFKIAGVFNFILAIGHLLSLIWAKHVFEAGGIGEGMNEMSQIHPFLPYLITIIVAVGFFIFGLYALSADGRIRKLPLLKLGIFTIAAIFILRSVMGFVEIITMDISVVREIIYSLVALLVGLLYLVGGINKWIKK